MVYPEFLFWCERAPDPMNQMCDLGSYKRLIPRVGLRFSCPRSSQQQIAEVPRQS